MNRSVITFATNQMDYVQFALNCAQSILLHNDLPVYIVSNVEFAIPEQFKDKVFRIQAKEEHAALGIGIKLYIDEYAQTKHTLFIDSDCICFGDLGVIFDACQGMDVSVAGNVVSTTDWYGEASAKKLKEAWGIEQIIRFNGGLYYVRRSAVTKSIFDKARQIAEKYDEHGFERIKNKWMNEEGPLAIAMVLQHQKPIPDAGSYMTDLFTDQRPRLMNVLTGARLIRNQPPGKPKYRPWYPEKFSPIILHFGGSNINSYPYKSQSLLLKLSRMRIPGSIASSVVNVFVHLPYKAFHWLRARISNS